MSDEYHCGPTAGQVQDANLRGDVIGTWQRCPECQAREDELLARIEFVKATIPPPDLSWIKPIR